jgi:hypothetical protein
MHTGSAAIAAQGAMARTRERVRNNPRMQEIPLRPEI